MPVYALSEEPVFPDPNLADKNGLIAVGGDLSTERLLLAYSTGIFPWYSDIDPILWWSPDPRIILYPNKLKISKSLDNAIRNLEYKVGFDTCFDEVICNCARMKRKGQEGTWITDEMIEAYNNLHQAGFAHSCEVHFENKLIGGLYGLSLGRAFFGESMFYIKKDASKIALYFLVQKLLEWKFHFIDAQVETPHLQSLGAIKISRKEFLGRLNKALNYPTIQGKW